MQLGGPSASEPTRSEHPPASRPPQTRSAPVRAAGGDQSSSRPSIKQWSIPFPAKRLSETEAYSARHYGVATAKLDPKVIVQHYTVTPTAQATFDIFARDQPDVELHELPAVCSHFVIDRDGTIYQLVPVGRICRHTVGLNDVAIGIEHVGNSDQEILNNRAQLASSLRLTAWLRCRYEIAVGDVIGHSESLSSPYHHEQVPALKKQTHADLQHGSMEQYRSKLAARSC